MKDDSEELIFSKLVDLPWLQTVLGRIAWLTGTPCARHAEGARFQMPGDQPYSTVSWARWTKDLTIIRKIYRFCFPRPWSQSNCAALGVSHAQQGQYFLPSLQEDFTAGWTAAGLQTSFVSWDSTGSCWWPWNAKPEQHSAAIYTWTSHITAATTHTSKNTSGLWIAPSIHKSSLSFMQAAKGSKKQTNKRKLCLPPQHPVRLPCH